MGDWILLGECAWTTWCCLLFHVGHEVNSPLFWGDFTSFQSCFLSNQNDPISWLRWRNFISFLRWFHLLLITFPVQSNDPMSGLKWSNFFSFLRCFHLLWITFLVQLKQSHVTTEMRCFCLIVVVNLSPFNHVSCLIKKIVFNPSRFKKILCYISLKITIRYLFVLFDN